MLRIARILFPGICICSAAQVSAKEYTLENLFELSLSELMNVEVVSKKAQSYKKAPGVVSVITAADIRYIGARNLRDILDRTTNLQIIGSNLYPHNRVSLRGVTQTHTDNKILLLLNGRPVRDANQGGIDSDIYNFFPIHTINKIEIIRGPGSVIYGTNAFSGVINIITLKAEQEVDLVHLSTGSFSSHSATAMVSGQNDEGQIMMAASFLNTDGDSFENTFDEFGNIDTYPIGKEGNQWLANGNWKQLSLNFLHSNTQQEQVKSLFVFPSSELDIQRTHIDLGYEHDISENWTLKFNLTHNVHEVAFDISNTRSTQTDSTDTIWEATLFGQLGSWQWLMGTTLERLEGTIGNNTVNPTPFDTDRFAIYIQGNWEINPEQNLVLGAQWHNPEEVSGELSPRIAYINQLSNEWTLKLLYGQAFRSPFATDLYLDSPSLKGNPTLKPESIKTFDLQFLYESQVSHVALTLYHSKHEDLHDRQLVSGTPTFVNSGEIKYKGIELEARRKILTGWDILGNASYQENEDHNGIENTTYNPELMIKLGSQSRLSDDISLSLFDSYFGKPTSNEELGLSPSYRNTNADAYHWVTFNAEFDLGKPLGIDKMSNLRVSIYIDNVLDEDIYFPSINRSNVTTLPHHSGRGYYLNIMTLF